ncbi:MAG: DUF342 domain-containing protein [Phycisphaerales bacterium]|nr:DUF342 domain-containing protein [Phycisphaerales bacterium]
MATQQSAIDQVRVVVAGDKMSATLTLPANLPAELCNIEFLTGRARERRVAITRDAVDALQRVLDAYTAHPAPVNTVFATGAPPVHGDPARLEWMPGFDPEHHAKTAEDKRTDFYNAVEYARAAEGQTIARIVPPTEGTDGVNVLGEVAKAKPGKPLDWQFDSGTVEVSGLEIKSKIRGVVLVRGHRVEVSDLIEVKDVDFHTGNINVEGGVHVRSDVKDRFEIRATQNIIVDGLVGSATIQCGGNLQLRRGMAAHERGRIDVKGDADVCYLNAVQGRVEGTLRFRNELINCDLDVGHDVFGDSGSIIGGRLAVGGSVHVASLGSEAEVPTRLVLGVMPVLLEERSILLRDIKHAQGVLEKLEQELKAIETPGAKLTAPQKERATEINYLLAEARQEHTAKLTRLEEVDRCMREQSRVDLLVHKIIHPKVGLAVRGVEIVFKKPLDGPVRLGSDLSNRLVLKREDGSFAELGQFVTVKKAA